MEIDIQELQTVLDNSNTHLKELQVAGRPINPTVKNLACNYLKTLWEYEDEIRSRFGACDIDFKSDLNYHIDQWMWYVGSIEYSKWYKEQKNG